MRRLLFAILAIAALSGAGFAADNSQQERMKDCNAQAAGMTGSARQTFMSSCLKGEIPAARRVRASRVATPASRSTRCATNSRAVSLRRLAPAFDQHPTGLGANLRRKQPAAFFVHGLIGCHSGRSLRKSRLCP